MISDIFTSGTLEMASTPVPIPVEAAQWGTFTVNRIAITVAVLLLVADLADIIGLMPHLKECFFRARGNLGLEHNVRDARSRNLCALICTLPFCLVADRYSLFRPEIFEGIGLGWSLAVTFGVLMTTFLLHLLSKALMRPPRMDSEEYTAAHCCSWTYFIIFCAIMLLAVGIMNLAGASDALIRNVLYALAAIFYLLSLRRCRQILSFRMGGLSTILYLCGLKILPMAPAMVLALFF